LNGPVRTDPGLQAALAAYPGSVTAFLEERSGEPVVATGRRHRSLTADGPGPLGLEPGAPMVERAALLCGGRSGRPYLAATSLLAVGRLPAEVIERLATGPEPIGRVLAEHGLGVARTPLSGPPPTAVPPRPDGDTVVLARTQLLTVAGVAVVVVTEWFLSAVLALLDSD
jgi:chorismate-pyruvate lyase